VLLDLDREAGEVGYLEAHRALERVSDGESIRAVARDLPNLTRQGLTKIHKDPNRRRWYLGAEADDERVDAALETVR
jgi:DNA-binding transcriptional ArsR family regulator